MNSAQLIAAAGEALYGPGQWGNPLARALRVNRRTITRWITGEFKPPPSIWGELDGLLRARQQEIAQVRKTLSSAS